MGPLNNRGERRKVQAHLDDARERGGEFVVGGGSDGLYFEPTIVDRVTSDFLMARDETFGPVAPIMPSATSTRRSPSPTRRPTDSRGRRSRAACATPSCSARASSAARCTSTRPTTRGTSSRRSEAARRAAWAASCPTTCWRSSPRSSRSPSTSRRCASDRSRRASSVRGALCHVAPRRGRIEGGGMASIITRMGDGYDVEMTPEEVRADLVAGSEDAAPEGQDPAARERRVRLPLRDVRQPQPHLGGGARLRGDPHQGRLHQLAVLGAALLAASACRSPANRPSASFERAFAFDTMEVGHFDYSVKPSSRSSRSSRPTSRGCCTTAIIPVLLRLHAQPGALLPPGRPVPESLRPAAARADRGGARSHGGGARGVPGGRHLDDRARWPRSASTASTTTPPPRPATASSSPPSRRSSGPAANTDLSIEVGMAAEFVLGFHGAADLRRRAAGRHVAAPAAQGGREGGRPRLRPGGQHEQPQEYALEPGPRRDLRQGGHRRARPSPSTPTSAWASAACRCSSARRRTWSRVASAAMVDDRQGRRLVGGYRRSQPA